MVRIPFVSILIFTMCNAFAQDTTYLDKYYRKIPKDSIFEFFRIVQPEKGDTISRTYYKSGKIEAERTYSDYFHSVQNGISKEWFETGLLSVQATYKKGKLDGILRTFWPSGKPKRIDLFKNDICINGTCFDSSGLQIPHFDYQQKPEFPGGDAKLIQYIAENTKYPEIALMEGYEGTVYIRFVITKTGDIGEAKTLNSIHPLIDHEALRVVKSMPKWKPGYNDGEPVNVWFIVPINFKLQ